VHKTEEIILKEKPGAWWNRVYLAVVVTTVSVIAALWMFSYYFSR